MQNAKLSGIASHCARRRVSERNPKSLPLGEGGFKIANALAILKTDEGCRAVIFRFRSGVTIKKYDNRKFFVGIFVEIFLRL